jgi:two-component system cell cycle sensor histidine kinase/response regulator CckA
MGKMDKLKLDALRKRAEALLGSEIYSPAGNGADDELRKALHELKTHQIELELQNEELLRVQEELVETRDRYVDLYDFAPVGYLTVDDKNRIVEANLTAAGLLGMERQTLSGQPFSDFIFHEDQDIFYRHFKALLASTKRPGFEVRMRQKDAGEPFWAKLECLPIEKKHRSGNCIRIALHDVTEAKRLEDGIVNAKKLEATAQFAGGIAHDFNNLLTIILGNLEMALDEMPVDRPPVSQKLRNAQKAALSAADLTRKFLTFSSGGEPFKKTASVEALIAEWASLTLAGSNVDFECAFPDELWFVEVDSAQMAQAIGNVVTNAREAMPQGGMVRIRAENAPQLPGKNGDLPDGRDTKYVKISIQDQGVGIPKDLLPRVFDPYFSSKEMGKIKGLGLGLAIAYSIIKRHGGSIDIASRQNVGTTVSIYLPAGDKELVAQESTARKVLPFNRKILVMDDEELLRDVTRSILERLGYEAEVACDGEEAIQIFSKAKESGSPFGLVILDLTIKGGIGGKETIKRLKELDPDVRAIVASGYSSDPVMANFREYGFDDALQKPYRLIDLRKALGETVDRTADS